MNKKLMLGNEAIARGAYEAGVRVASAYPGTPSTEITESIAQYKEVYAEWSPNEKVAMEVAVGASIAGARAMVCMKHVGVNVAADPLFTFSYIGANGSMVVVVADDPGMHSSQNEQDSRYYARASHIPMLEPSNSQEAKDFTKLAFEISEQFETPVFVRTTTRISHSQSFVTLEDRKEVPIRKYEKDITRYAMMPSSAIGRHIVVEKRDNKLKEYSNTLEINKITYRNKDIGIITSGIDYQYTREALPDASVLKIGMVHPIPMDLIKEFAKNVKRLVVIESLEPFIEDQIKAAGIKCDGKNIFSLQGELSVPIIKNKLLNTNIPEADKSLPIRPPVMCPGCPHRGVYYVINKLKLTVSGDIGCYTLGAQPPLSAVDTVVCMGASVGVGHGFEKALGKEATKKVVSVIGDSTFIHSGITGLVNAVYNQTALTLLILDNSTTGMTGHQQHPATGKTLKGNPTYQLDLEQVARACGVKSVRIVDAFDLEKVEKVIKEEIEKDEVSVIIAQRPCALLKEVRAMNLPPFDVTDCKKCGMCLRIGCPAIEKQKDKTVIINKALCVGCGICAQLCRFGCIKEVKKND